MENLVKKLEESVLFNLSLGSKELFHSNIIAWFWKQYPDVLYDIFKDVLPNAPKSPRSFPDIYREKQNIDLYVEYKDDYCIVIENKVKSLPNKQQLEEYSDKFKDKPATDFVLLSLSRPAFFAENRNSAIINNANWYFMSYSELAGKMDGMQDKIKVEYHRSLWQDYVTFIKSLTVLVDNARAQWSSNFFYEFNELRKLRVNDLIEKLKFSELVEEVKRGLREISNSDLQFYDGPWTEMAEKSVSIVSGMTRSVGLFDLKYAIKRVDEKHSPAVVGIQLQGEHLRLFFENICKDSPAEKVANKLYDKGLWFSFSKDIPSLNEIDEYPLKPKRFNKFGNSFYYRNKKIGSLDKTGLKDISKIIISHFLIATKDFDKIKSVLDEHL